jgi:hypothetical protein
MKSIGAVLAAALLLGACTISGPKVKVKPVVVKVDPVTVEVGGGHTHCPPGHAKKKSKKKKNWC